jgi:hypothetical protein
VVRHPERRHATADEEVLNLVAADAAATVMAATVS